MAVVTLGLGVGLPTISSKQYGYNASITLPAHNQSQKFLKSMVKNQWLLESKGHTNASAY